MQNTLTVAALLTCHNRKETTLACLSSLYSQSIKDEITLNVFLTDDASTDGTGEAVREQYPQVHILHGDGNLFWCGGMRLAWQEAMKHEPDHYLWLNDDTMLTQDALQPMLKTYADEIAKESGDCIIVGSTKEPGSNKVTYCGVVSRQRLASLGYELMGSVE